MELVGWLLLFIFSCLHWISATQYCSTIEVVAFFLHTGNVVHLECSQTDDVLPCLSRPAKNALPKQYWLARPSGSQLRGRERPSPSDCLRGRVTRSNILRRCAAPAVHPRLSESRTRTTERTTTAAERGRPDADADGRTVLMCYGSLFNLAQFDVNLKRL